MKGNIPRILIAATGSGSGKTLLTCGLLQALKDRQEQVISFKCGPDYIDPMFHERVIGTKSRNLDPFFAGDDLLNALFLRAAKGASVAVLEGVMGYYDGLGGVSPKASAWNVAVVTKTPTVLVVNGKGMSVSLLPLIKGFLEYRENSRIRGIILNQVSAGMYPMLKKMIEDELPVKVYGYLPYDPTLALDSRHLGLVLPGEIEDLNEKLTRLAAQIKKSVDLDGLLALAGTAEEVSAELPVLPKVEKTVVAVAKDEAFCFLYQDNLELLEEMGAELLFFSPIHDKVLPKCDGLLLCGGYPELYARELSENESMKKSIRSFMENDGPTLAECGGFMYLHETMEDMDGRAWPMVGSVKGSAYRTGKLGRFGYITLTSHSGEVFGKEFQEIRAHEFHYFDSTNCGTGFHAKKPVGKRSWDCAHVGKNCVLGFPHLYYYSEPEFAHSFLSCCVKKNEENRNHD